MYSEFVYVLRSGPYYKIGRTKDFNQRISQLRIQLPFEVELFKVINTDDCAKLEKCLHQIYAEERVNGEWFELSDESIANLFLVPASVSCKGKMTEAQMQWDDVLDSIERKLDRRSQERKLDLLISGEAELITNDIPEYFGDLRLADMLAAECPYPPDATDFDWLVADDGETDAEA